MVTDRRIKIRVPDNRLITEIVSERPNAASLVNVSDTGFYSVKPTVSRRLRGPRQVQVEIPLPEASESVWALGEVVFERLGLSCIGSGIRFLYMADGHRNLIRDLVAIRKQNLMAMLVEGIQEKKDLAKNPSPFAFDPPKLSEDTVKMYLLPYLRG